MFLCSVLYRFSNLRPKISRCLHNYKEIFNLGMGRKRKRDSKDEYSETDYIIEGKVRHVVPYIHEYTTYAKGRWIGKTIIDVLLNEFGGHPPSYWKNALLMGHVQINNQVTSFHYIIQNNDKLSHRTHRHEPPIVGSISLVGDTETLMAVNKPASLPMHPCGAYRYNSLMVILAKNPLIANQPTLSLVHRLDRVTSGLVVLAKTRERASQISEEIRNKETKKVYLARVRGRFPGNLSHLRERERERDCYNSTLMKRKREREREETITIKESKNKIRVMK